MHEHYGFHESVSKLNRKDLRALLDFRVRFLKEELHELKTAKHPEDVVDALIDVCVVAIGTLDLLKVDAHRAWDAVHAANMGKRVGVKPSRPNPLGLPDLVKPVEWRAPSHAGNVGLIEEIEGLGVADIQAEVEERVMSETESARVLRECIELQLRKSRDYQNPHSTVKQADHYRRGIDTIHDMIDQKLKRAQSLLESGNAPNCECLEDTYKDTANYCSFAVSYLRCRMDGQRVDRDIFNRPSAATARP
jgi:hypothetical protein